MYTSLETNKQFIYCKCLYDWEYIQVLFICYII